MTATATAPYTVGQRADPWGDVIAAAVRLVTGTPDPGARGAGWEAVSGLAEAARAAAEAERVREGGR